MVVFQAARAFEIFTGRKADGDRMRRHFETLAEPKPSGLLLGARSDLRYPLCFPPAQLECSWCRRLVNARTRLGSHCNRPKGKTGRTNNAEASRAEILAAATREFSEKGLSGARVDEIAERTQINKRMIYYYFESKEGLYRAVLERCYGHIRMSESAMDLESLSPEDALRQLIGTHSTTTACIRTSCVS